MHAMALLLVGTFLIGIAASTVNHVNTCKLDELVDEKLHLVQIKTVEHKKGKIILTGLRIDDEINPRILIKLHDTCHWIWTPNQLVQLNARVLTPNQERVPGGFNYRKYLASKNIQLLSYPTCDQLVLLKDTPAYFSTFARSIQHTLMQRIDKVFAHRSSKGLVKGILLGHKEDMEREERELYSLAGVGHVFAVSGMHVGMVYLLCWPFLFFRSRSVLAKITIPIMVLILVWLFVIASGMTPSAVRAGTMISLYELGKMLHRKIDKWNILSVTAIFAAIWNPQIILDIGFQFSYLALIGIFFFFSKFRKIISSKLLLLSWISDMVALSFSAQLTLLPLSLYYFGSFSPYFWLSSLIAMLVVQINFIFSFLILIIWESSFLAEFLLSLIDQLFICLADCVELIMTFPGATWHWKPSMIEMIFSYQILISLGVFMVTFKRWKWLLLLSVAIAASICAATVMESTAEPHDFVLYESDKVHVQINSGAKSERLAADELLFNGQIVQIGNKKVLKWRDDFVFNSVAIEVLVIDQPFFHSKHLDEINGLTNVIVTSKVKWGSINFIKSWCKRKSINFHHLSKGMAKLQL